ncbi:hypothetical protein N779_14740 [Vibrio coralliilyticus OCN008]|nr:hypothetical protein N779_14740 [Vibrio coralliilyticus OCN008]
MNKQRQLGIDKQLVIVTLLVSLVLAFVMAGVNFYVDYQAEQNNLDKQMLQIEDSYVTSLQNSLWIEDQKQLTTQASSIFQLPAVDRLTIIDSKSTLIELGNEITGKKVINVWDLTYQLGNKSFTLGQLRIETDLAPVYHALWQKFLFLLVMTLIQTLLIVSCLLWLTMKLILKPISHLSSAMADFHTSPTPNKLVMPKRLFHDEISHLTDKYNQCAEQLRVNYQQIIESKEKAEIANVKKSEFLANMSHEIRTPMNGIVGVAELLKETKPNEVQRNYVDILLTSSHTLLDIINDILDFSKIEAGHFELDPTKFDLKSLIQQQANEYSIRAKQQELFFDCNIDPAVPQEIEADSVRLKQVINNLIGNALSSPIVDMLSSTSSCWKTRQATNFSLKSKIQGLVSPKTNSTQSLTSFNKPMAAQPDNTEERGWGWR